MKRATPLALPLVVRFPRFGRSQLGFGAQIAQLVIAVLIKRCRTVLTERCRYITR
jgi:hypothetical protein